MMNDVLSMDQMAGLFNHVQDLPDVIIPFVQCIVCELLLLEKHDAAGPVDLSEDPLVNDHVTDLCFCTLLRHTNQVGKTVKIDLAVVFLNNPDVMLNQLSQNLLQVKLEMLLR